MIIYRTIFCLKCFGTHTCFFFLLCHPDLAFLAFSACFGERRHNNLDLSQRKDYFPERWPNQVLCRYRCMTWRYRRGSAAPAHKPPKVVRRQTAAAVGRPKIKDQRQPEEAHDGELMAMEGVGWDLNSYLQSSGVAVSDECKTYFEDIKKAKKYRWVIVLIRLRFD